MKFNAVSRNLVESLEKFLEIVSESKPKGWLDIEKGNIYDNITLLQEAWSSVNDAYELFLTKITDNIKHGLAE